MKNFKKISASALSREYSFERQVRKLSVYRDKYYKQVRTLEVIDMSYVVDRKADGEPYFNWVGTIRLFDHKIEWLGLPETGYIAEDLYSSDERPINEFNPPVSKQDVLCRELLKENKKKLLSYGNTLNVTDFTNAFSLKLGDEYWESNQYTNLRCLVTSTPQTIKGSEGDKVAWSALVYNGSVFTEDVEYVVTKGEGYCYGPRLSASCDYVVTSWDSDGKMVMSPWKTV